MMERFRAFWTKVISPVAHLLIRLGVSADAVTLVGTLGVCAGALVFFPQGKLLTGVLVITAFVFSDLHRRHMARLTGKTQQVRGVPRLHARPDRRRRDLRRPRALLRRPGRQRPLPRACALVCLVMGAVTSYARARAEGLGFQAKVGIAERADRLVAILVMTGLSGIFDLPILM